MSFKIAAPFVNIKQIRALKKAGADELYCGYVDEESEKRWPSDFHTINRRGKGASFEDFTSFKAAVEEAKTYDLPVYVTFNCHYTPKQYPWLLKTIDKISKLAGVKGLIISDIALLLTLRKINYEKDIHISTGATIFNHYTVDFFANLGAKRAILDRQLTIREMIYLVSNRKSDVGIEIFIFHTGCLFVDGYCSFFHCQEKSAVENVKKNISLVGSYNTSIKHNFACMEIRELIAKGKFSAYDISGRKKDISNFKYELRKYPFGCNLCSLYELKNFSEITLKIVERGLEQPATVRAVSRAIKHLANTGISQKAYQKKAKELFFKISKTTCNGFTCYCPPALIKEAF